MTTAPTVDATDETTWPTFDETGLTAVADTLRGHRLPLMPLITLYPHYYPPRATLAWYLDTHPEPLAVVAALGSAFPGPWSPHGSSTNVYLLHTAGQIDFTISLPLEVAIAGDPVLVTDDDNEVRIVRRLAVSSWIRLTTDTVTVTLRKPVQS